jgi:hypothetical protein
MREANPALAVWAAGWRARHLNGKSMEVEHVLLGFACDPMTAKTDNQVVRFAVSGNPGRGFVPDSQVVRLLRRATGELGERTGRTLRLDGSIPTDWSPDFGDGTVPLFSATGGALARVGQRPNLAAAADLLGPRTRLVTGTLAPGKGHSDMLDDPAVRKAIVTCCRW